MKVGIVGYGAYVPKWRIGAEAIAEIWGQDADQIKSGLGVKEKSVPSLDEDTATIAVEAARNAIRRAKGIKLGEIGAIYVGSESHPYAVKPTAVTVAEAVGLTPHVTAADTEFACKAGTAGIQACLGLVRGGYMKYGMAIGADTSQSAPGDALEYTAAAGGAAYIIGAKEILAEVEGTHSYTQDVPDFWRREGSAFPRHAGRFTGEPAYFEHVLKCSESLMEELGTKAEDYDYAVFHMPNGKFPLKAASILGFDVKKVLPGLVVQRIGNTYSGSSMLGLAAVLDQAKEGDRIFMTSYGSGAGSDSFSFVVTDLLRERAELAPPVEYYIQRGSRVPYSVYAKYKKLYRSG
ncbi:MAG TPA: hydroxymethylglutaryl-CoA synthase [Conexivisphaerales archaeon]|nr:hydroxymethylglutaryl-CoA synthase [Conexivisphaerales archaeon]